MVVNRVVFLCVVFSGRRWSQQHS